jgi:hypothetical protein
MREAEPVLRPRDDSTIHETDELREEIRRMVIEELRQIIKG